MDIITEKYVYLISSRLPKFTIKQKHPLVVNFRCVICNDSQKNKNKARGYIIDKQGKYFYICHNGCKARPFDRFLKKFDFNLYEQMQREKIKSDFERDNRGVSNRTPNFKVDMQDVDFGVVCYKDDDRWRGNAYAIDHCGSTNIGREFIQKRNIPKNKWSELFWVAEFKRFVNLFVPKFDKESLAKGDYNAIIIPILDIHGTKLIGFQGRVIDGPKDLRYMTISLVGSTNLIYNINNVDLDETVYVFEGPFDSMHVSNSVAAMGGSIHSNLNKLVGHDRNIFVIVYDNEPRSKFNVKHINEAIENGYQVCIWNNKIQEKDVNEFINNQVESGIDAAIARQKIKQIIDQNIFEGLGGMLALSNWAKVK